MGARENRGQSHGVVELEKEGAKPRLMQSPRWQSLLPRMLSTAAGDPRHQELRIRVVERNLGLPVKLMVIGILFYYLFATTWMSGPPFPKSTSEEPTRHFAQEVVQMTFLVYAALNIGGAFILRGMQQIQPLFVQWAVFTLALMDGLFLAGMILITGGLDSSLYWLYLLLLVRNTISVPAPLAQIMLNVLMPLFYAAAVFLDATISEMDHETHDPLARPLLLRLVLMGAVGAWCYGLEVLLDKQLRSLDELRELALRREQLEASGRLAAEIAHQLKNPLGIINNAAFTLQRTVKEGKKTITQQIQIIREEVDRSDRIITELMGYAQLVEGRVEKLDITEELDRAILQVFPPAVKYEINIVRDYAAALPQLLAQRNHLAEVFVNLMQNAKEAMNGHGTLTVSAAHGDNFSITVSIGDDGPGIPPQNLERIFEAYFSTREKGTGLGLAIVKHNVEMYGGRVWVESELGKGTRFAVQFPARTLMKLKR